MAIKNVILKDGSDVLRPQTAIENIVDLGQATSSTAGLVKLGSSTAATATMQSVSTTANRQYALQVNSSGQASVNVPWTDTANGFTAETWTFTLTDGTIVTKTMLSAVPT